MNVPTRVLLADDHPALRVGLCVLLDREPDIQVTGEADAGSTAFSMLQTGQFDVAVLDCQLPELDGVAVAQQVHRQSLPVRVVALSAYDDDRYLAGMQEAGAIGYLLKNEAPTCIVDAVRAAVRGESLWTPEQQSRIQHWQSEVARLWDSLTAREREVLQLVTEGLSNKEIAQALTVTVRTADFHVSNILRKLNAVSRVEAAVWAREHAGT
ncbi:MAG: response regulator transcription factor [Anaerolineae bacterium]|nr:response regulator transcription factor [Anaerolineae bacterium]